VSTARVPASEEPSTEEQVHIEQDPPPDRTSGEAPDASADPVVRFARCDLAEILRDSVGQASTESPSVPVEIHAPQMLPARAATEALSGVVRILVDNACRRTDPGLSVMVKANRADEGIAVHVFERGSGVDRGDSNLDLARSLVALHGGVLWSEPLPAGGAKMSFVIPREPPPLEGLDRVAAIRALDLLAQLEPAPRVEAPEQAEAIVDVGLLDGLDEPQAILDVTNLPARPTAEEAVDPPASDVSREAAALQADLEPDPAPQAEPGGAEPNAEDPGPGDADRARPPAPRTPKRGRWGWGRGRPVAPPPEEEPPATPMLESPVTEVDISKPEPASGLPRMEPAGGAFQPEDHEPETTGDPMAVPAAGSDSAAAPEPQPGRGARVHQIPVPFVPDPLHPATQMLRALLLDEEKPGR
jgi:hypothetical protein